MQAPASLLPVPLYGRPANPELRGNLLFLESRKDAQLDHANESGINLLERFKVLLKDEGVYRRLRSRKIDPFHGDVAHLAPALLGALGAGMLYEDSAHEACGKGEKLAPLLQAQPARLLEAKVDLVHERGGFERMGLALPPHRSLGALL